MSRTIIGLIIALAAVLKDALGLTWLEGAEVEKTVTLLAELGGLAFAWYGRVKATGPVSLLGLKGPPPPLPPLLLVVAALGFSGCATAAQEDQTGQGPARVVASSWNSVATTEDSASLRAGPVERSGNPAETTVEVTRPDGSKVTATVRGDLRDFNLFFGDVDITTEATIQGTTSGVSTTKSSTPTTTVSPETTLTPR